MLRLIVNGEPREVQQDLSVSGLLEKLGSTPEGVAVELNLKILDRQEFGRTVLKDGDRLEIIRFVGGG